MWTLSIRPSAGSGFAPVDVTVRAKPSATVHDLAVAIGRHLANAPEGAEPLVVPVEGGVPWPADRPLAECGLRSGSVLDVTTVPASWVRRPGGRSRRRAVLRVVAGPDTGRSVAIGTDTATLGRGPACTVTLTDPLVSRQHARVLLTPDPVIVDEGSAHGTVVDGATLTRPTAVPWGTAVSLGDSLVVVERAGSEAAPPATGILRPPRFGEPLETGTVEVPTPPAKQKPQPPPWAMLAMPLVLGFAMLMTTRSPYAVVYLGGYPLVVLFGFMEQRRRIRKEDARAIALWRTDVDAVLERLDGQAAAQAARAGEDHPDLPELETRVRMRHPALWARQADDSDFLAVRVGRGPVSALLTGDLRDGGDREQAAAARAELDERRTLADLPVPVELGPAALVAVAGPAGDVDAAVRTLVLRLCCDHSPAEVSLAAVLGQDRAHHETWLRWLPHTARRAGGLAAVAVGAAEGQALLERLASEDGGHGATVCLVDEEAGLPRRIVEGVAQLAADRRLHLVWLGRAPETAPAATDVLLDVGAPAVARRDRGGVSPLTGLDTADLGVAWRLARAMTAFTDEAAVLPPDTALPERVRLADLAPDLAELSADPDDPDVVAERWASSRGLRAQLGVGVDGVVTLDLRDDGPHALVAGTTGSGKSELLQTLILSLALNSPPQRVVFLLVDYKGGAAFRECADLPHTVGYLTDLTPALVQRALTSLGAEITAREQMLGRHGAKDLRQLEREHPDVAPPSLLICVDEFAALTAEVPEFVDGMVNIAQRGRSLGMHLMLATQRPAGVVTPNIRANTDLRIALRVSSTDDSSDVIDMPDAASISRRTPGRAWIRRTGHGTAEMTQVAWVGAQAPAAGTDPVVEVAPFTARELAAGAAGQAAGSGRLHPRSDLDRLVGAVRSAFARTGAAPPARPWLPPLPAELLWDCATPGRPLLVTGAESIPLPTGPGQVPFGLVDQPHRQAQPPAVLDYPQLGHVLVFGASGSGKTELLRTLAVAATLAEQGPPPLVYALDFGGGGLSVLDGWPSVGAVVGEPELGRVMRLVRMLHRTVAERNRLLAACGAADLAALAAAGHLLPRVHVLVDNLPAFVDALDGGGPACRRHVDLFATLLQEGRRAGVHVTATSPRRTGVPTAMQAAFGQRMVLRMATDDDYAMIGVPTGVVGMDSPPGRGLLGRYEIQVGTVGGAGTPAQAEQLARLGALVPTDRLAPMPVPAMPGRVPAGALPAPERDAVALGVEADYVTAVPVPLCEGPLLIAGRAGGGKTSLLAGLAALARRSDRPPAGIALVGPRGTEAPGQDLYDRVLTDPAAVLEWLPEWQAASPEGWRMLLVDDAHLWERGWEAGGPAREAVAALAATVDAAGPGLAVVVATDTDDARSRQHVAGMVQAARRGRRGMLLQPDLADGGLLGVTVPMHSVEPMIGIGRGLWCNRSAVAVVQTVAVQVTSVTSPEEDES